MSTADKAVTCLAIKAKCLLRLSGSAWSSCWLGWRIQCILHTSFGCFEESTVIINDRLAFLIRFFSLFRVYLNMFHSPSLRGRAWASWGWFARFTCREPMLWSFSQGTGGWVIFILFSGACLSRHSVTRQLKIAILSLGLSKANPILDELVSRCIMCNLRKLTGFF